MRVSSLLAFVFRRRRVESEMEEELRAHLQNRAEDLERQGLCRAEAERRARIEFGGYQRYKEECREAIATRLLGEFVGDIRYGLRQLRRSPGFAAVAVITLALGIGATTAIFSVVQGILLKPLPYPAAGQLVSVGYSIRFPGAYFPHEGIGTAEYFIYRGHSRAFEDIGLYSSTSVTVSGRGQPERLFAEQVTDGVLPILGVSPFLGRLFAPADERPDSPDTVILTYGYWCRKFGCERSAIGKTIETDGKPHTIIGVLPQHFRFLDATDLAMLLPMKPRRTQTYLGEFDCTGIARLKARVTLAEANADVARMIPIVMRSFPPPPGVSREYFKEVRLRPDVRPLKQAVIGDVGRTLWPVMGGIGLVLLIACANVASLLLVRVEARRQELGIRGALGATPGRIARGLLVESLVLSLLGGALGLAFADGSLQVLLATAPSGLPRLDEISISGPALLFDLAVALIACPMFGLIPVLKYSGVRLATGLREAGRSLSASREGNRARNTLVIVQIALAVVLLISSGLMIRTFLALTHVQPGFTGPETLQTFRIYIPDTAVKAPERVLRIEHEILERLNALPGVSSAGISQAVPMDGHSWSLPVFMKDEMPQGKLPPLRKFFFVSPEYFETIGTPLIAGRYFTWNDIANERPVALVSENLARDYYRNPADVLGKEVRMNAKDDWRQIVGVVGNIHDDGTSKPAPASVYFPLLDARLCANTVYVVRNPAFAIRTRRAGSQILINEIRQAVWSVNANLPLADIHTLEYYYRKSMARTSFTLVMLALAGGMALLLGIVGLCGVISYSVSQRMQEFGIRLALGADQRDLLSLVLGQGLKLALIGLLIGVATAVCLTRFLSHLLYGVKPTDPLTFAAVSLLLSLTGLLASYIPARRATKVDPMTALREE